MIETFHNVKTHNWKYLLVIHNKYIIFFFPYLKLKGTYYWQKVLILCLLLSPQQWLFFNIIFVMSLYQYNIKLLQFFIRTNIVLVICSFIKENVFSKIVNCGCNNFRFSFYIFTDSPEHGALWNCYIAIIVNWLEWVNWNSQ